MSFLIFNGQTRKLFDIVENRQLPYLERYFNRFPLSVRENVQIKKSRGFYPLDLTRFYNSSFPILFDKEPF
ncbi:predicted protein [Enterococcus faecalis Fly1]|nr:predicted protein [Enterococcus faecalis Fly1]